MPSRNGKQIRDRFLNYLDPHINKVKFTDSEDKLIIEQYKMHGSKWSVIAKCFPGRTGDMIKNRFYSCLKRRVHIYEQPTQKRNRKKYYKSRKHLSSISPNKLSTSESPDLCLTKQNTPPHPSQFPENLYNANYTSTNNNNQFITNNDFYQQLAYDNKNNNSLGPLIAINISQNNNYKYNTGNVMQNEHEHQNAENCICSHCNPTLPLSEKNNYQEPNTTHFPTANYIHTPNYLENYYNDSNFQSYLLYAQNQGMFQQNSPNFANFSKMFPITYPNKDTNSLYFNPNEQILASLYNLSNMTMQRNANLQQYK